MTGQRHYIHRLTFQQPTESTDAKSGQVTRTFADAFTRRGFVQSVGTENKTTGNNQQVAVNTYEIELRHDSAIDDILPIRWRVVWEDNAETLVINNITTNRTGRQQISRIKAVTAQ